MLIYSIYDTKAEKFAQPFFVENYSTALRLIESVMDEHSLLFLSASDYELYEIGSFDMEPVKIDNPNYDSLDSLSNPRIAVPTDSHPITSYDTVIRKLNIGVLKSQILSRKEFDNEEDVQV